jgi:PKD repeat protein
MLTRRLVTLFSVTAVSLSAMAASNTASAAPPSAPTSLAVAGQTITWVDQAIDETGFVIERCTGGGCTAFGQIATVAAGVTSYTDTFMVTGTNRYRVRAFNADGSSAYSNLAEQITFGVGQVFAVATATPVSGTAPLTVSFDGSVSADLMGAPATSHTWRFGDDQSASGSAVSHTYTQPGVYAASLRVTGGTFGGADSTAVLITVTAPPLVAPSNLVATSPSRGRVVLSWSNQPSSATSLAVERCKGSTCTIFVRIATVSPTTTSYTDATVNRGTTYSYRIAATDGIATVFSNRAVVTVRK